MPINVVKTKKQEKAWEKAKRIIKKQYPSIKEGSDRFYRLVMKIFKDISGYKPKSKLEKILS